MASKNHLLVVTTIFLCLYLQHVPIESKSLLDGICNGANVNPQLCMQTLGKDPVAASAHSAEKVANVALAIAKTQALALKTLFESQLNAGNPDHKAAMKICGESFDTASKELNLSGLEEGSASLDVHYALDGCTRCESSLKQHNVQLPPDVAHRIQHWKSLFNIAYSGVLAAENSSK